MSRGSESTVRVEGARPCAPTAAGWVICCMKQGLDIVHICLWSGDARAAPLPRRRKPRFSGRRSQRTYHAALVPESNQDA
jgi:hypothetical protein